MNDSFSSPFNKIDSATQWVKILEKAVESRNPSKAESHQYVSMQGRSYILLDKSSLKEQKNLDSFSAQNSSVKIDSNQSFDHLHIFKLPLSRIVEISKEKFEELKQAFEKGEPGVDADKLIEFSNKVSKYTEQLIDGRESKRNQIKWKVVRGVALVLAVISTAICGVGVYLLDKLNINTKKFKKEIADLKAINLEIKNHPLKIKLEKELSAKLEIKKNINASVDKVPEFLEELKEIYKDENRLEVLQAQMNSDISKTSSSSSKYVHQFAKDMERGCALVLKDTMLNINDNLEEASKNRDDILELPKEKRAEAGAKLLQRVLHSKQDKAWEVALQIVSNQTSINNLFDTPIMLYNSTHYQSWVDPDNKKPYGLLMDFPDKLPPIKLEIIRNEVTQNIEKVNVEVLGTLDIISRWTAPLENQSDEKKALFASAVKGKLTYVLTLDENNNPVVSDLKSQLETAIISTEKNTFSA